MKIILNSGPLDGAIFEAPVARIYAIINCNHSHAGVSALYEIHHQDADHNLVYTWMGEVSPDIPLKYSERHTVSIEEDTRS